MDYGAKIRKRPSKANSDNRPYGQQRKSPYVVAGTSGVKQRASAVTIAK